MKKKILVVDNQPVMLRFMSGLLGREGHEILTAGDGLTAIDILKTVVPDVIFIDLIIPHISGEKLCRIIRNMPRFEHVYIVIISAIAVEQTVNFTEFGANACIAKGPLNKMEHHILSILKQMGENDKETLHQKILGYEEVYSREITKELLSIKQHFEVTLGSMAEGILEITEGGDPLREYSGSLSFQFLRKHCSPLILLSIFMYRTGGGLQNCWSGFAVLRSLSQIMNLSVSGTGS